MPRFAANLSMMFTEVPFPDRFERAQAAGFSAVEFLFPYEHRADEAAAWSRAAGLQIALFNLPPGDFGAGERGLAALPGREAEFRRSVDTAIDYALRLDVPRLHAMAGLVTSGARRDVYIGNLRYAAGRLADHRIELLIEPINRRDIPSYFLSDWQEARSVQDEVGAANLKLQCDLYHLQILHGDVIRTLERDISRIGHVQIAGVPERHEPDEGELAYAPLFELLDSLGYAGWVGCEYRPRAGTEEGLGWFKAAQSAAPGRSIEGSAAILPG